MEQLALDFNVPAKTGATTKPPLLRRDVIALTSTVQIAQMWMKAGFVQRDADSLLQFAEEMEGALDTFAGLMLERECPDDCDEWFAAYSQPVRAAIATLRQGAAERTPPEPQVELRSDAFDRNMSWTARKEARSQARRRLYVGTKMGVEQQQPFVHHWRLLLEDAVDVEACQRRIAWHESKVLEAGCTLQPAIHINTGLRMIIEQPLDRRALKDHADAVRVKARKSI